MSAFDIGLIDCTQIQTDLDRHFSVADYTQYFDVPLVLAMTSEINTANLESLQPLVSPGNGKIRRVTSLYTPRILESEVSTSIDPSCTSENRSGRLEKECEIDISQGVYHSEVVGDIAELAPICESNPDFLARRIAAAQDVLLRKLETGVHQKLLAQAGGFSANDTGVSGGVKTIVIGATGAPNPRGLAELRYTKNTLYQPRMWLFGQNDIAKYFDTLGDGCCADAGVDLGTFYGNSGLIFFNDFRAESVTDTNGFFGLIPGAAHIVYYNRYGGTNAIQGNAVRSRFTVTHGPTGLPFDVGFSLANGCDNLIMEMFLAYEVCAAPTTMFATGDELAGYNGILEFVASAS